FCDTFLFFHSSYHHFHAGIAELVDLGQVIPELSFHYEIRVTGRMMLFQKVSPHSAIFAELILLLLWKFYVWDKIIPLLTVYAAHFFKDRFHDDLLCVFWFRQLLGYFNSFPITAFQFTTNEPQSYVLDGRNHPLHSNSWFDMELLSPCISYSLDSLG